MKCTEAQPLLSSYLDGAVNGVEMHEISVHLRECSTCDKDYGLLEKTRVLVSSVGHRQAPPDLALKIRIRISTEKSRGWRPVLRGKLVGLQNAFQSFMLPATAGMLSAVFFFSTLIGFFVVPPTVDAYDVPTGFYTPPRLESSPYPMDELNLDSPIMIETDVDAAGRVENYRIISGRDDAQIREELNRALLFTIFAPAQAFGRPVPGKAVISFSHVNVRG